MFVKATYTLKPPVNIGVFANRVGVYVVFENFSKNYLHDSKPHLARAKINLERTKMK